MNAICTTAVATVGIEIIINICKRIKGNNMDYEARIADIQGAIRIKTSARQSTAVLVNKLARVRTLQIKAEMRDERKRLKAKQ